MASDTARRSELLAAGRTTLAARLFWIAFAAYIAVAATLLAGGLLTVVIDVSPRVHRLVDSWPAWVSAGLHDASGHSHGAARSVLDFVISVANFVLGLVIVWLRPNNATARLVALGAIGTAAAFNLESHTLFFAFSQQGAPAAFTNALHMGLHALSGAAYLHAFLSFPDGKLEAVWARRTVAAVWGLAIVETVGAALNTQYGVGPIGSSIHRTLTALGDAGVYADDTDVVTSLASGDALFFVAFFGLFVPAISLIAQARRYQLATTAEARQQSRLLAWALTIAFGLGITFFLSAVVIGLQAADPPAFFQQIEGVLFRVFAPLFTVIPVALLVGVVRYRLWSVDEIVRHILVYASLTIALAVAYVSLVAVVGLVLRPMGTGLASDLALVLSTLAVAALFMPVYRRLRRAIDRRFRRYVPDAAASVGDLVERVDGQFDVDTVRVEVLRAVDALFRPRHVSMWFADDTQDRE